METKYIIGLLVGVLIYAGAVSGLYLIYKPNLKFQKERRRKLKEERRRAMELAQEAKKFQQEHEDDQISHEPEDPDKS